MGFKESLLVVVLLITMCGVVSAWEYSSLAKQQNQNDVELTYTQQQYWFEQIVDHENYQQPATWQQRYFVIKDYFKPATGPVILYICGQSICNGIRDTRSWPAVIAQQTGALILTLEHRYYGQSLPFKNNSLSWQNLKYLNSQQALKDLAYFMNAMKKNHNYGITDKTPWITMGGSYPGALSAWFRYKYPHLTIGAIASSAVVLAVQDFSSFDEQIYRSAMKSGQYCVDALRQVTQYAQHQVVSDRRIEFQSQFKAEKLTAREFLFYWADVMVLKIQYGGRTQLCNSLKDKTIQEKFQAIKAIALTVDPADYGAFYLGNETYAMNDGRGARAWIYQSCTQFSYFQTPSPSHPMRSQLLTIDFYRKWCEDVYGIDRLWPYVNRVNNQFGGLNLQIDNLIMSNGDEDPWRWATLQKNSGKIISQTAVCDNCAHCQDFHTPTDKDPTSLKALRAVQMTNIKKWISDYWQNIKEQ